MKVFVLGAGAIRRDSRGDRGSGESQSAKGLMSPGTSQLFPRSTTNVLKLMKPKILIVDDDRPVLESLTKLLKSEHYEVFAARDAIEAIDCFNSKRINLVVLDINLGADNGWAVFETMTTINPFVPTIVITAEWGQQKKAAALGVEGLIEKPIDVPVFLKMIRELLAETTEAKLKRICGNDAYCRYVGRHYEPYLRMLQERYNAPLQMTGSDSESSDTDLPTVIVGSSDVTGSIAEDAAYSHDETRKEESKDSHEDCFIR